MISAVHWATGIRMCVAKSRNQASAPRCSLAHSSCVCFLPSVQSQAVPGAAAPATARRHRRRSGTVHAHPHSFLQGHLQLHDSIRSDLGCRSVSDFAFLCPLSSLQLYAGYIKEYRKAQAFIDVLLEKVRDDEMRSMWMHWRAPVGQSAPFILCVHSRSPIERCPPLCIAVFASP